jgi:hypothetical protein
MLKKIFLVIPMLLVIGCANPNVCSGTKELRDNHKVALLADGGDESVVSGAILLRTIEAACGS